MNPMRKVTFNLSYFEVIAKYVEKGQMSDCYSINSNDSPDHLKTTISIKFTDDLNTHLLNFVFPKWMGKEPRVSVPWSDAEEKELLRGFKEDNLLIDQLCEKHGRGKGGILSRLQKHIPGIEELYAKQTRIFKLEKELEDVKRKMKDIEQQIKDLS
jgi:hypothetical protein